MTQGQPGGSEGANKGPVVLVVDDETDLVELMQARLSRRGFQVSCAHTASDAIAVFDQVAPEMVICDIHLGTGSGIDVLRRCRSKGSQTPFVFLSGPESFDAYKLEVGNDERCEFVHKPVDFNELLEIVRNLMEAE